jgi:hypothetical protein
VLKHIDIDLKREADSDRLWRRANLDLIVWQNVSAVFERRDNPKVDAGSSMGESNLCRRGSRRRTTRT